jgi:predicted metal-binding membrane protein
MRRALLLRSFAQPPWPLLFAVAGLGLVLSAHSTERAGLPAFCGSGTAGLLLAAPWSDALDLALALNPPLRLAADWALMLLAMMPPLLVMPLSHVWRSSLPRRRVRALAHFILAYAAVWMAAGPTLIGLALLLQLIAGDGAFVAAVLLAIVWSASPWQRAALNRGHRLRRFGLFGWAADRECVSFGAVHATWCVAACWPFMLVPLVAGRWHVAAMMGAGAVMLAERLAAPDRPRWRLPFFLSLLHCRVAFTAQGTARHG